MTASAAARKADGNVKLAFGHHLAKVTMTIDAWSNEYDEAEKTVNSLKLTGLTVNRLFLLYDDHECVRFISAYLDGVCIVLRR